MVKGRLEKLLILAAVMMFAGACAEDKLKDPNGGDGGEATRLCGNGKVDSGEECDGGVPASVSCPTERPVGTVTCSTACKLDDSGCTVSEGGPQCNNGVKEAGEECDQTDLGDATCDDPTHVGLKCNNCVLDKSECKAPVTGTCGNSTLDTDEDCDGDLFKAGVSCPDPTHTGLKCTDCALDTSDCKAPPAGICGDDVINDGEECDNNTFKAGAACPDPSHFGLKCNNCALDTSDCKAPVCGNNTIEGSEVCDGTDLGSATCPDPSHTGLKCKGDCSGVDTSDCKAASTSTRTTPMFTEYLEGSSYNKALEITNFSSTAQVCKLELVSFNPKGKKSGGAKKEETLPSIAPGASVVFCNSQSEADLKAKCDHSNFDTVINFNGNDALILTCGGAIVDTFGSTINPGVTEGWDTDPAGGTPLTKDHTLRRKCGDAPDTNPDDAYNVNGWDVQPIHTYDDLQAYTCP